MLRHQYLNILKAPPVLHAAIFKLKLESTCHMMYAAHGYTSPEEAKLGLAWLLFITKFISFSMFLTCVLPMFVCVCGFVKLSGSDVVKCCVKPSS